jgi:hypothetical protein
MKFKISLIVTVHLNGESKKYMRFEVCLRCTSNIPQPAFTFLCEFYSKIKRVEVGLRCTSHIPQHALTFLCEFYFKIKRVEVGLRCT